MPLLDPPCFKGLVGCYEKVLHITDRDDSGVYVPPYGTSNPSGSFGGFGSGNNLVIGPGSGGNGTPSSRETDKDQYALYTVTLKNLGTKPISGLQLNHGPVPFGSTFNPLRSSKTCQFFSPFVQCNQSLDASQTKKFPIVYKITNGAHCRITPVLQTIRAAFADPAAGAPPVSATVQCTTLKGSELANALAQYKETAVPTAGTGAGIGGGKHLRAVYGITLKNLSNTMQNGVLAKHGPVPGDATFDAGKSDGSCSFTNTLTTCHRTIAASESQKFNIVYKVTDPLYCEHTAVLKTMSVASNVPNAPIPPVSATIDCVVEDDSALGSDSGTIDNSAVPEPQTGANDLYYQSMKTNDYILVPKQSVAIDAGVTPIFFVSCISIVLLGIAMFGGFSQKKGLN